METRYVTDAPGGTASATRTNSPRTPNDGSDHTSGSRTDSASADRGPRCRRTSTASSGVSPTLVMVPDTVTTGTPASVPTAAPPPPPAPAGSFAPSRTRGVSSSMLILASAGAGSGM